MTHICVSDLTSIGLDNGLSPGWRQAIIRTNAGILLIRPLGTNFSEFLVAILIFSFKKMHLKVSSAKRRPFCLGLNELTPCDPVMPYDIIPGTHKRTLWVPVLDRCPRPAKTASVQQINCLCWSERPAINSGSWKFPLPKCCSKHTFSLIQCSVLVVS